MTNTVYTPYFSAFREFFFSPTKMFTTQVKWPLKSGCGLLEKKCFSGVRKSPVKDLINKTGLEIVAIDNSTCYRRI
jgi:hypothetical protein